CAFLLLVFFSVALRAPCSPLFPYTTLFRSGVGRGHGVVRRYLRPVFALRRGRSRSVLVPIACRYSGVRRCAGRLAVGVSRLQHLDRKSTRLNSSHVKISYAVFCLKKKKGRT